LRPFREESQYFVYGKEEKYSAYATNFRAKVVAPIYGSNVGVRFDEYFRAAVTSSAGPFVALGNPEDYIPPEGASRLYAKDSDWKERLDALARRALWIIVEIGSSDHLSWEFDHLRREGLQQKLFIITPPAREASGLFGGSSTLTGTSMGLVQSVGCSSPRGSHHWDTRWTGLIRVQVRS
jgi:hypothetical protein